jgi:serine/threonine protein kinase
VLIKSQPPKGKWWVKISDFGISKRIEGSKAQSTVKGTLQYMAPELIYHVAGNSINYLAADMWALGTMVYRLLTLMPVFPNPGAYTYYLVNVESFPLEELKKRNVNSDAILFIRSLMGPRLASVFHQTRPWAVPGWHLLKGIQHQPLHRRHPLLRKNFTSTHFRL